MIKDIKNIGNKGANLSLTGFDHFAFRISRFVTVVYMVSNCVPEQEQLRSVIANESISLLSLSKDIEFFEDKRLNSLPHIQRSLSHIKSLFDIVYSMQYISLMNYSIIVAQIEILLETATSLIGESHKKFGLDDFFNYGIVDDSIKDNKGQIKDSMSFKTNIEKQPTVIQKDSSYDKSERLNKITDFLKSHTKSSIKDISVNIGQMSEKTVQRDLTYLVSKGAVIRHGERRWSTYSLNNI